MNEIIDVNVSQCGRAAVGRRRTAGKVIDAVSAPRQLDFRGSIPQIVQAMKASPATCYILDSEYRFILCNPAWDRFARSNGAASLTAESVLGCDLFASIPEVLRPFYTAAFQKAREESCWEKRYHCSSFKLRRIFRMRIHLLKPQGWFLVTNNLVRTGQHPRTSASDGETYVDRNGLVTMCAHCRCSRRVENHAQWDFVPKYLRLRGKASLKVSHGICPVCWVYFYQSPA
jgi:hypothetical protein